MNPHNEHSLMPTQCSYCGCWLEAQPGPLNSISHGMCKDCFAKLSTESHSLERRDHGNPEQGTETGVRKVVIIDDDPGILFLLTQALHRQGYEVLSYSHPADYPIYSSTACPCGFPDLCPNIVISDYSMPHVSGLDFFETLKQKSCRCRHFALMSGYFIPEHDRMRITDLGVVFFKKPFHINQILAWLDEINPNEF